jgi:putative ABC transport system substrate-binding protein
MDRRAFIASLASGLLAAPLAAEAQPARTIPRIGILRPGSPPDPYVEAFRQGLRELGYLEGRSVSVESRWAEGRDSRLPGLANELVRLKPEVILAGGIVAIRAAKGATTTIPIVMPFSTDPVRNGFVQTLNRPGGNVTGFASQNDELPGKWTELLKEALPKMSRVAVLWDPTSDASQLRAAEVGAKQIGVALHVLRVTRPEDFRPAFAEAQKTGDGLVVLSAAVFAEHGAQLVALAAKHRLPTMYHQKDFVTGGGLMSYGADIRDLFRRAAEYVDKILKGSKPADLPVEQPTKFELVINLKTAKALGLTIPQSLLQRADQVIE